MLTTLSFDDAHDWATRNPSAIAWSTMLQDITRQADQEGWNPSIRQSEVYCRLITKQVQRAYDYHKRIQEDEAALANVPPLASGRQRVSGRFVSCKYRSTHYGETLKGLFKCVDGNKIWLTVPAAVRDEGGVEVIKSLTIAMSVDVTAKEPHFGFGNRPTQVQITNEPEHDHDADAAAYDAERINERAQEDTRTTRPRPSKRI
jgi:hypothetical protein